MSVKSKAKTVGAWLLRYGLTLGVGALVDRYVKGAAGRVIKDLVAASTGLDPNPKKLTRGLQAELDKLVADKVLPTFQQEMNAMRADLEARLGLTPPPVPLSGASGLRSRTRRK